MNDMDESAVIQAMSNLINIPQTHWIFFGDTPTIIPYVKKDECLISN